MFKNSRLNLILFSSYQRLVFGVHAYFYFIFHQKASEKQQPKDDEEDDEKDMEDAPAVAKPKKPIGGVSMFGAGFDPLAARGNLKSKTSSSATSTSKPTPSKPVAGKPSPPSIKIIYSIIIL